MRLYLYNVDPNGYGSGTCLIRAKSKKSSEKLLPISNYFTCEFKFSIKLDKIYRTEKLIWSQIYME